VPWYLVDAPSVVCTTAAPPAPGRVDVTVPLEGIRLASLQNSPHVFTFYRTTKSSTSVTFQVVDSKGESVVPKTTVELRDLSRRLGAVGQQAVKAAPEASPRQMRGGHAGGFGGHSRGSFSGGRTRPSSLGSPRRRTSVASARRRITGASSGHTRSSALSARRRGAPVSTNLPSHGVGGSHYQNTYGQSYGFTRPQTMNQYYPGGYAQTGYGYTGANSYRPNSGSNVMMAALGGAALGVGASYMYSRWNSYENCQFGSSWSGSCRDCYAREAHSSASCQLGPPKVSAHRDDLMSTGFWPDDWTSPLIVTFWAIEGQDFAKNLICAPQQVANASSSLSSRSLRIADLFFTLTQVDELGSTEEAGGAGAIGATIPLILVACCCICACAATMMNSKQTKEHEHVSESEAFPQGQKPVVMTAPVVMGNPVDDFAFPRSSGGGFMDTMSPSGISWRKYCDLQSPQVDPQSGMLVGVWGECLAWAKAYEAENPQWPSDPEYTRDGPCGQVLTAVADRADCGKELMVEQAAEMLESACEAALISGAPLPIINHMVALE